jgi:hypothetical protein
MVLPPPRRRTGIAIVADSAQALPQLHAKRTCDGPTRMTHQRSGIVLSPASGSVIIVPPRRKGKDAGNNGSLNKQIRSSRAISRL